MIGELIMLPLRVGVRATRLWLRAAEETAAVAAGAAGRVIDLASSRGSGSRGSGGSSPTETVPPPQRPGSSEVDRREQRSREVSEAGREAGEDRDAPVPSRDRERPQRARRAAPESKARSEPRETFAPATPTHVSEEPALVEELAEPGAEDGAGAEIHVEEPWEGYAQMNAKEIIARLNGATRAALASVQLYESSHRHRQTILNAARRELRSANGRSSRSQERG
jgi:hypothetical protein